MSAGRPAWAAVLLLAGCALRPPARAPAPAGRVAVLPFHTGGTLTPDGAFAAGPDAEPGPGDHGASAARLLTERLAAAGVPVADPARVLGAATLAGADDPRQAARVAQRLGADFAVLGTIVRYREREGSALAVRSPASVAYQLAVVRAADRSVLVTDRFDHTQQPLSENLLDLPMFLRGGGRWMTREEMLGAALAESAEKIAAALRAGPRAAAGR
jgi:hypothetical protein